LTAGRIHRVLNNVYRLRLGEHRSGRGLTLIVSANYVSTGTCSPRSVIIGSRSRGSCNSRHALTYRVMIAFAQQHRITDLPPSRPIFKRLRGIRKWKGSPYRSLHVTPAFSIQARDHLALARTTDGRKANRTTPSARTIAQRPCSRFGRQELSVFPRSNQVTHFLLDMAVSSV
jgi:hypothetical protein